MQCFFQVNKLKTGIHLIAVLEKKHLDRYHIHVRRGFSKISPEVSLQLQAPLLFSCSIKEHCHPNLLLSDCFVHQVYPGLGTPKSNLLGTIDII